MKKCATGGGVNKGKEAQTGPHEEETNKKTSETMEHPDEYKGKGPANKEVTVEKKKGGRVKRARGGHVVHGKPPGMRLDKKARGGSAKSPLSGADAPNLPYAHGSLGVDKGGHGKKVKAH